MSARCLSSRSRSRRNAQSRTSRLSSRSDGEQSDEDAGSTCLVGGSTCFNLAGGDVPFSGGSGDVPSDDDETLCPRASFDGHVDDEIYNGLFAKPELMIQQDPKAIANLYLTLFKTKHSAFRVLRLQSDSLYTAAYVIPNIARSSGWRLTFTAIAVKMCLITLLCMGLQFCCIFFLEKAITEGPANDGTPYMCTYGTNRVLDPDDPPRGPFGTKYEPDSGNLESDYTTAKLNNFLYAALRHLNLDELADDLGSVEYGMESPTCRLVCVLIFCISISGQLHHIWITSIFLRKSPTMYPKALQREDHIVNEADFAWISFDPPAEDDDAHLMRELRRLAGMNELSHSLFKMNGSHLSSKIWGWTLVAFRSTVLVLLGRIGMKLLLNTGSILDLIMNAVALNFVLDIDSIMFNAFTQDMTKDLLDRLEPYDIKTSAKQIKQDSHDVETSEDIDGICQLMRAVFSASKHFILVLVLCAAYILWYLHVYCHLEASPFQWKNFQKPGSEVYFKSAGTLSWFGGYDFWLGRWASKPVRRVRRSASPTTISLAEAWTDAVCRRTSVSTCPLIGN